MISENTLIYLIFAGAIGGLLWVLFLTKFTRYLYEHHPEVYNEIGQPPLSMQPNYTPDEISSMFSGIHFVVSGRYRKISDANLARFGDRLRLLFIFDAIILLIIFGSIAQLGFSTGKHRTGKSRDTADVQKAYDYYEDGKYSEALDILNDVIKKYPDNSKAYYYRGFVYEKLTRHDDALLDFEKVVGLDPDNFDSYSHIDWHYARKRDWNRIITYWDKYIERNPADDKAYLERGGTYYHSGELNLAMKDAKRACDLGNSEGCKRYDQVKTKVNK